MKLLTLALLVTLLAHAGYWTPAAVLSWPLVWVVARKTTIRQNGLHMMGTGAHRFGAGDW